MITLFGSVHFFNFVSYLLYPTKVKRLKCAMLGAFTVRVVSISLCVINIHVFSLCMYVLST